MFYKFIDFGRYRAFRKNIDFDFLPLLHQQNKNNAFFKGKLNGSRIKSNSTIQIHKQNSHGVV